MSESEDESSKTEDPSERKLGEAREKGNTWNSREVGHWTMFLSVAAIIGLMGAGIAQSVMRTVTPFIEKPDQIPVDAGNLGRVLVETAIEAAQPLAFPIFILMLAGIIPTVLQTGFLVSSESIKPKLSKLSPMAGLKKIFSANAGIETLKNVAKLIIVGSISAWLIHPELLRIDQLIGLDLVDAMAELKQATLLLLAGIIAVMFLLASADIAYQRYAFMKKMRMSKQDVKEEYKQAEGDPMIKMRLRQIRFEKSRRRMMAAVPKATVVVTNPTHYAVALLYEPETMPAPKLVAKGADLIAKRIRELAAEHKVPIVENPPAARALFAAVEIDEVVPPEHYKVVAEIISYVFKIKKKALSR
jgi:flagellar biosynthetic protein FlhB